MGYLVFPPGKLQLKFIGDGMKRIINCCFVVIVVGVHNAFDDFVPENLVHTLQLISLLGNIDMIVFVYFSDVS